MSDAAEVGGVEWAELNGALLLITPKEAIPEVETPYGPSLAVRANVAVLDGPRAGEELVDVLILPRVLQSNVRPSIDSGGMVLGRLGVGRASPGGTTPWLLRSATEADKAAGRRWVSRIFGN